MNQPPPRGWRLRQIGDVAHVIGGGTPSRAEPTYWDGGIPWATPTDLTRSGSRYISITRATISPAGLAASGATLLPPGSVLMTSRATLGVCAINSISMATNQGFQNLVPSSDVLAEFLVAAITHRKNDIVRVASGSTFLEVSRRAFAAMPLLVPPLGEQRKIAAILSSVDDAIEATQAVIAQLQVVKQAVMTELLTRGLPGRHTRFKEEKIGRVPEEWNVDRLESLATVQTGIAKGKKVDRGIDLPYLRVANVQDGFVDLSEMKRIVIDESSVERFRVRSGDVLFTEGGDADKLGRGCVWNGQIDPCLHQNHVFVVRPDAYRLRPAFLSLWAASPRGKAYFLDCAKQTTNLASINSSQLKALPVPIPAIEEQDEIIRAIGSISDRRDIEQTCLDHMRTAKSALMSVLLTGELRVTPDDAAASPGAGIAIS